MMLLHPLPAWAMMWLLALLVYLTCKCATLAAAHIHGVPASRKAAYLLLFPGMNAAAFCAPPRTGKPHLWRPTARYTAIMLCGAALLWGMARLVPAAHPYLQGWIGMIGLILLLHFGFLQLVALAWQAAGRNAPLLMNEPLRSASVTEFWSLRWNTAFHQLAHQFLFKPMVRTTGPRGAMLLTFVMSGLVHDLIISLPAGGGFGLPTAYFALQAVGLAVERSHAGRRLLHHELWGRLFATAVVVLPVPLLFHQPFVARVVLPFMTAVGALPAEVCL